MHRWARRDDTPGDRPGAALDSTLRSVVAMCCEVGIHGHSVASLHSSPSDPTLEMRKQIAASTRTYNASRSAR